MRVSVHICIVCTYCLCVLGQNTEGIDGSGGGVGVGVGSISLNSSC